MYMYRKTSGSDSKQIHPFHSQGDGNIRYYEITTEKPYLQYLMEFRSPAPQKGLGK
jgi:hypothetical protein